MDDPNRRTQAAPRSPSRRAVLKGGLLLGGGALLAACGSGKGTSSSATASTSTGEPVAAATSSARKAQTITFWVWLQGTKDPRAQVQTKILDLFKSKNPDVNVVTQVMPWSQLEQQLIQALAAGKGPDVCWQLDGSLGTLVDAGALEPLDGFTSDWTTQQKADYLYDWNDTVFGGKKYAFRQGLRVANRLYYRSDLYAAAGFTKAPVSASDYLQATEAAKTAKIAGFLQSFSKSDNLSNFLQIGPPLYWSLGSDLVDANTGKPTFQGEAGQEIFAWYQDAVWKRGLMSASAASMGSDATQQVFIGGASTSSMTHSEKYSDWSIAAALKGKLGTVGSWGFGTQGPAPVNTAGGWTLVMPKGAKGDAAWRLIEFFQSNEAELLNAKTAQVLPTRKSCLTDPWFKGPEASYLANLLADIQNHGHAATTLGIKNYNKLAVALANAAQEIIVNRGNVAKSLADAAKQYQSSM